MRRARDLRRLSRELAVPRAVSAECKRLLEQIRHRCPGLIPPEPLPPGRIGAEIPLNRTAVQRLITTAAAPRTGAAVLWTRAENEMLVMCSGVKVTLDEGIVLISIPVRCDEVGEAVVKVPFAVGDEQHPAGMIAATEHRPRGPDDVVDLWGEALIAFAWHVLITATNAIAEAAGTDEDGAGLIPVALTASKQGLRVQTMARHPFDRIRR